MRAWLVGRLLLPCGVSRSLRRTEVIIAEVGLQVEAMVIKERGC